jgi:hypothetical protein
MDYYKNINKMSYLCFDRFIDDDKTNEPHFSVAKSSTSPEERDKMFTAKEKYILLKAFKFFSKDQKFIEIMSETINKELRIKNDQSVSLRILDWLVNNYSRDYNVIYDIDDDVFDINMEYKIQLGGYTKLYFDPFCRKNKIIYNYKNINGQHITFITSIGQLNFFHWAIRNKIIEYAKIHIAEIIKNMHDNITLKNITLNNVSVNKCHTNDSKEATINHPGFFVPIPDTKKIENITITNTLNFVTHHILLNNG